MFINRFKIKIMLLSSIYRCITQRCFVHFHQLSPKQSYLQDINKGVTTIEYAICIPSVSTFLSGSQYRLKIERKNSGKAAKASTAIDNVTDNRSNAQCDEKNWKSYVNGGTDYMLLLLKVTPKTCLNDIENSTY